MSMIKRLRAVEASERPTIITELYEKNCRYFKASQPGIAQFLDTVSCPYHIDITESFLNIVHTPSGLLCHPDSGLDGFAEVLGSSGHHGWVDLVHAERVEPTNSPSHVAFLHDFQAQLERGFPDLALRLEQGRTTVTTAAAGVHFSPPVAFIGLMDGLHIDHFLSTTEVTRILLVEPEPERFEVSCYFIDYERLSQKFGVLPLSIGPSINQDVLNWFHVSDKVTSKLWLRILPGYESARTEPIIRQIALQQHLLDGMTTSLDNELRGLTNGWRSVEEQRPILTTQPVLSEGSRIVIVASGPSLEKDYGWLREQRDKLILFAMHSAVLPLRKEGIVPDFQFSIDMHLHESAMQALALDWNVPLIAYFKASRATLAAVDLSLLVAERDVSNPVNFFQVLANTHPSTATMALSFARYCNPSEIYLVGLDLGFSDREHQAIRGGIHDVRRRQTENLHAVTANFPERGQVLTTPFFNAVRLTLERELSHKRSGLHCCNLSDGAKIKRTTTARSAEVNLESYPERSEDLLAIKTAFQAARETANWEHYETPGTILLDIFRDTLVKEVTMEQWDWPQFCYRMDNALHNTMGKCRSLSPCLRMTVYERLVVDLLTSWYRYLLLARNTETAEGIYRVGYNAFQSVLEKLVWPIDETTPANRVQ